MAARWSLNSKPSGIHEVLNFTQWPGQSLILPRAEATSSWLSKLSNFVQTFPLRKNVKSPSDLRIKITELHLPSLLLIIEVHTKNEN